MAGEHVQTCSGDGIQAHVAAPPPTRAHRTDVYPHKQTDNARIAPRRRRITHQRAKSQSSTPNSRESLESTPLPVSPPLHCTYRHTYLWMVVFGNTPAFLFVKDAVRTTCERRGATLPDDDKVDERATLAADPCVVIEQETFIVRFVLDLI